MRGELFKLRDPGRSEVIQLLADVVFERDTRVKGDLGPREKGRLLQIWDRRMIPRAQTLVSNLYGGNDNKPVSLKVTASRLDIPPEKVLELEQEIADLLAPTQVLVVFA